ncbi:MAG: ATP-binding protein [bacterium]
MKPRRYILIAIILLIVLGIFMTLGIVNSRREMMHLIKEEARSFLSVVASTQENAIFAEGKYEDEIIDKLISVCHYLEATGINKTTLSKIRQSFQLNSVTIFDINTKTMVFSSGNPLKISSSTLAAMEKIFYEYFDIGQKRHMHFVYKTQKNIFQIEISAEEVQRFREEFGINKIITQLSMNPTVEYLVLQDKKGIIFATPNIQTITKIEDDSVLISVYEQHIEMSRITEFEDENILELVRPFIVSGQNLGLFRIGISLDGFHRHVRATERQLIVLFVILFGAGFVLFYFFAKYQSYMDLRGLFDKTLGAVEDGILTVDSKGLVIGVNEAFSRLSSFDEKMILNHNYFMIFKNDPFDIQRALKQGTKVIDEKCVFERNIQYSTYPLLDTKRRISGAISVLRDITKLKAFEKEREETERLKFLGNLVANFAHEIKNPLNGLSIATQRLVKEFSQENKEYIRLTTTIKKEIEALNKILNDFLSLVRPRIKEKKEFNLSLLIQDTIDLIRGQANKDKIELKCNIKKDVKIYGNMEDFKRAVLNILLNAVDALSGIKGRKKLITIDLTKHDDFIQFKIIDNGKGMDTEEQERIFTPYFTMKKKGTGLGLFIAQKIINDHNAEIKVTSERDRGTTFNIYIKI